MVVDGEKERAVESETISVTPLCALMPTLCWSSPLLKSTTDGLSLAVETAHQLKLAIDDEPILKIQKFPPPGSLDILSTSSILMRLAGSFGAKQVSAETLRRSSLASYLLEYLKFVRNASVFRRAHSLLLHFTAFRSAVHWQHIWSLPQC